ARESMDRALRDIEAANRETIRSADPEKIDEFIAGSEQSGDVVQERLERLRRATGRKSLEELTGMLEQLGKLQLGPGDRFAAQFMRTSKMGEAANQLIRSWEAAGRTVGGDE